MKTTRCFCHAGRAQLRVLVAATLTAAGVLLAVMSAGEIQHAAVKKSTRTATGPSAAASREGVVNPLATVRRVLASYGISASPQRRFMQRGAGSGVGTLAQTTPNLLLVGGAVEAKISPALRDIPAVNPFSGWVERPQEPHRPNYAPPKPQNQSVDPVLQVTAPAAGMPPVGASFEGMNISETCKNCLPPDPVGAVGPQHYVQMVNSHIAVFDKTGKVLVNAKPINGLWSSQPRSECFTHNNGDPIVLYDQLADRWLVSQFVVQETTENYAECIAISKTSDPGGAYYLYEFDESNTVFHDYPHLSVWPDAYYMSTNQFPGGAIIATAAPAGAWAFERQQMLQGAPAKYIFFDETSLVTPNPTVATYTPFGQLPTHLEGKTLPPSGPANLFAEVDDVNQPNTPPDTGFHDEMRLWKFHVDWNTPANSTFGSGSTAPVPAPGFPGQYVGNAGDPNFVVPVADFVLNECQIENGPNDCVPEKFTSGQPPQYLDVLGDRLMFRLVYRNFGDHESLVANHTVDAAALPSPAPSPNSGASRTGVRWYELRNVSTSPQLYQQGTFAPLDPSDPNGPLWRWMGSITIDANGNIAIGYSASGPNYFPALHYAGRLAGDPLGEMTQGEAVMFPGQGIEANTGLFPFRNRWGDYSALVVDPTDEQTFWYTNEYVVSTPTDILPVDWHTRVGSFKFGTAPTPTPSPPSPTPKPTTTPTPKPKPNGTPAQLLNISTRARVQTGENVAIGGFIIKGNGSKNVLLRGLGPSLKANKRPIGGRLMDPIIELRDKHGALIAMNDNWKDDQEDDIKATGLQPHNERESAIARRLDSGAYTVIMRGKDDTTGIGLVEAYDLDKIPEVQLENISTRAFVETGNSVMIGGFITGPSNRSNTSVVVRAIGPTLTSRGVPDALQDPVLQLHDANGAIVAANDNWETDSRSPKVAEAKLEPKDPRESALYRTLPSAPFTAIVRGKDNTVGNALVEVYNVH